MIGNHNRLYKVCSEYNLVENYDEAINDKEHLWILHHRDEIRELPSGMVAIRSVEYLKLWGLYYHRPANELIFLRNDVHGELHASYRTEEHIRKISEANKGCKLSEEHRRKISDGNKGKKLSDETKQRIADFRRGKKLSDEVKRKVSESSIGRLWFNNGITELHVYECPEGYVHGRLKKARNV